MDTNSLELFGLRVNNLTVIEKTDKRSGPSVLWRCHCVCGRTDFLVRANTLKAGNIKSCGCKTNEIISAARKTHGHSKTERTYQIWRHMRERCEKKHHKSYSSYGGRGITVCQRWAKYENFLADMGLIPINMTLGRIDNNLGYSKGNCRYETFKEQANNRRNSVFITFDGKTLTLSQWAEVFNIGHDTLSRRISSGWNIKDALTKPVKKQKNNRSKT